MDKHEHQGRIIKFYNNTAKINRHKKKQKRNVLVTTEKYSTCEIQKGPAVKDKNFHQHTYDDIVCIDIWPQPSKIPVGTKPFGVTVWTNEKKEEKKGWFSGVKLPGVKLPGVKLPGIPLPDLPKVDLPKIDLPKIDLPKVDMPKVDLPDLPDISMPGLFKRKKEPKPKRLHPATKGVRTFTFVADGVDTKPGNMLMEEVAWVIYAAWNAHTRRHNPEPFYLEKQQVFDTATEIVDCRPKLEEQKAEEKK